MPRAASRGSPPFDARGVQLVGHEVFVQSGDMDAEDRPAHEVAMQLPGLDPGAYTSLEAFVASIQAPRIRHRIGVSTTIGRGYTIVLSRFQSSTTLLSPRYREYGFIVVGMITFDFLLLGKIVRRMISTLGRLLADELRADPKVTALVAKANEALGGGAPLPELTESAKEAAQSIFTRAIVVLRDFWETGALPASLEPLVGELLRTMLEGLQGVRLRAELGVGGAPPIGPLTIGRALLCFIADATNRVGSPSPLRGLRFVRRRAGRQHDACGDLGRGLSERSEL